MDSMSTLTAREREVLQLVAHGRLNKEIKDQLQISQRAVEKHISSIFQKLGVTNRTEVTKVYWCAVSELRERAVG